MIIVPEQLKYKLLHVSHFLQLDKVVKTINEKIKNKLRITFLNICNRYC